MIFIRKLYDRAAELRKILFDQICKLVTGKDCLILDDAYLTPGLNNLGIYVPKGCITQEICIVMEETCRSDNLSVAGAGNVHHLCRL